MSPRSLRARRPWWIVLLSAALGCAPSSPADDENGTTDASGSSSGVAETESSSSDVSSSGASLDTSDGGESSGSDTGIETCADPMPAGTQDVSLVIETGTLYGTYMAPEGCPPFRTVLFHVGSGPTDRDGNTPLLPGSNDGHLQLAQALQAAGVASLRYDKRGIAASAGTVPDPTVLVIEDYVDDLAAWIELLNTQPDLVGPLTVLGHSEGSLIATLAVQTTEVDALISIGGPGRPLGDVLLTQLEPQLDEELYAQAVAIVEQLEAGNHVRDIPPQLASLFGPQVQTYVISMFAYDPAQELAAVAGPITIIGGASDVQSPPSEAETLAAAQPTATLVIIEGMTHVFKSDEQGQDAAYTDPTVPLADGLVETVLGATAR